LFHMDATFESVILMQVSTFEIGVHLISKVVTCINITSFHCRDVEIEQ